jgi:hypothetical protein
LLGQLGKSEQELSNRRRTRRWNGTWPARLGSGGVNGSAPLGVLINLSLYGACWRGAEGFPPGARLTVQLEDPPREALPALVTASRPNLSSAREWLTHLAFEPLRPEQTRALVRLMPGTEEVV